jgi:hypothetical protein
MEPEARELLVHIQPTMGQHDGIQEKTEDEHTNHLTIRQSNTPRIQLPLTEELPAGRVYDAPELLGIAQNLRRISSARTGLSQPQIGKSLFLKFPKYSLRLLKYLVKPQYIASIASVVFCTMILYMQLYCYQSLYVSRNRPKTNRDPLTLIDESMDRQLCIGGDDS